MEEERKGATPEQKTSVTHTVEAAKKVRKLVKEMYIEGIKAALEGRPVVWLMVSFVNPIVQAMDLVPILPENWAGLCATKRVGEPYILRAESEGFSNVICSYARIGLGYCSMMREYGDIPPDAPDGGMARPVALIGSSMVCDTRFKWFQSIGRYLDVPCYNFDALSPPAATAHREDVRDQYVKYQVEQYRELIKFLEELTGRRMDWDKLRYHVDIAWETMQVWNDAYEFRKSVPCPMGTEDHMNIFVPGMMQEGDPRVLDFFQDLYDELKYRAENRMGVIPDEKYRLLWGSGLPPWHTMKVFNYFGSLGAVFVYETCYKCPDVPPDMPDGISDPLERIVLMGYLGRLQRHKRSVVGSYDFLVFENPLEWIEPYQADGVVFHWNRSCRGTTPGQLYYKDLVDKHSDVPSLLLESDMCDVRDYFEAEWQGKIQAFLETVDARKKAKRQGSSAA